MNFAKIKQDIYLNLLERALQQRAGRKILLFKIKRKIYKSLLEKNSNNLKKVQLRKYQWLRNLIEIVFKNIEKGNIDVSVARKMIKNLGQNFLIEKIPESKKQREDFKRKFKISPPAFIVVSPTQKCNLRCKGCYASSSPQTFKTLNLEVFVRILKENHDIFGSRFVTISGGEPLLYRNKNKNLLDVLEMFKDTYFIFYTNGTLINQEVAARLRKMGNASPQISVEGFEKETDQRRGKGVFKKILKAIECLRKEGVPFGISVTGTRENINLLLEDKFYEFWFDIQGASYMWMFQFMPIGKGQAIFNLMPSPQQRLALFRQWEKLLEKGYPIADFWNSGVLSNGCIAYGRGGGYFYIDWEGNISPCVFVPYCIHNIYDLYKQNKTLADALFSDFFKRGREWQRAYGYQRKGEEISNWLMPCSIRDHYSNFKKNILTQNAKGIDEAAELAKNSKEYFKRMLSYEKELSELTQPIWEREYKSFSLSKEKEFFGKMKKFLINISTLSHK